MRSTRIWLSLAAVGWLAFAVSAVSAQQVTVGTPFHAVNDSFFEQFGTHWGFNYKGLNVNFGGPAMGVPQFGNFDPNAGIRGGFGVQGGDFNGFFNFAARQGSRRSLVSQTPSVTLTNGYPGYISDTSQSPFVVGVVPVVGGLIEGFPIGFAPHYTIGYPIPLAGPAMQPAYQGNPRVQAMLSQLAEGKQGVDAVAPRPQPARPAAGPPTEGDTAIEKLAGARSSSAGRAVPSVAEARRLHQLESATQNDEAMVYFEKALGAEDAQKPGLAKIYYNMALNRATGELRARILAQLKALSSADTP